MRKPNGNRAAFTTFGAAAFLLVIIAGCMRSGSSGTESAGPVSSDAKGALKAPGVPPGPNRPPASFAPAPHPAPPEPAGINDRPPPVDMNRVDADSPRVVGPRAIGPITPDPDESDHHQPAHQMQH